jgi:hypothetical protein
VKRATRTRLAAALSLAAAVVIAPAIAKAQPAPSAGPSAAVLQAMAGPWVNMGPTPPPAGQQQAAPAVPESTVNNNRFPPALEAVMKPWVKAGYEKYKAAAIAVTSGAVDKEPPTPDNMCLPFGMPGDTVASNFAAQFYFTPKVVGLLLQLDTQMRLIHMNAQHPADLKPSFHGHSVGHWEGDTLVVDSVGFDERSQFVDGVLHGPKLRVTERFRLVDDNKLLEKTYTFTDEDAFTAPYTVVRRSRRADKPFQEYLNAQNNVLYPCPTAEAGSSYQPFR